jgi:hypothetical protein
LDSQSERFAYAQWVLERNLHWVSAAEVKTGVIVTLNIAMLGGLAAAFTGKPLADHSAWANLLSIAAAICLLASLFCAAMSLLPRTDGPKTSFVFFGKIAADTRPDYADAFNRADQPAFLQDLLDQIHRNAEIACAKFRWVRNAMSWSFGTVILWTPAIACLLKN